MIVIKPTNELFKDAVDYRSYRLIKNLARKADDVANELSKMTKKTDVQMKDRIFNGKDTVSIVAFLQDFKEA